ncbi:type II secretion system major pseudopilin GspG [Megalodesulfovibrio paquesii]
MAVKYHSCALRCKEQYSVNRNGFTLMELLIVVVILGLLAGIVGPNLFGKVEKARQATARTQIEQLGAALDSFRLDVGRYPTTEEGLAALNDAPAGTNNWQGPYLRKKTIPQDPWNRPYQYTSPGQHGGYDLVSFGADGREGGSGEEADVVSWE